MKRALLILTSSLTLTACGPQEEDPGPGGVTVGEARALDEAAEMLDSRTEPAPLPETMPANPPAGQVAIQPSGQPTGQPSGEQATAR